MSTGKLTASALNPTPSLKQVAKDTNIILSKISITENSLQTVNVPGNSATPNLEQHMQNARNCANTWNNSIKPSVASSVHNITLFSNSFDQLYTQLSANATTLQSNPNNADAIATFQSEISTLLTNADNIYNQSVKIQKLLFDFYDTNASVTRNFQADYNTVNSDLQAKENELNTLSVQMNQLHQQLEEAEEKRKILDNPGIIIVTGGLSAIFALIENLQGQINRLEQNMMSDQQQVIQDRQEIVTLSKIAGTLTGLLSMTSTLQSTMLSYITSWQSLSDNIKELQDMANISPTDGWALSDLQAVNSEWKDIAAEVVTL